MRCRICVARYYCTMSRPKCTNLDEIYAKNKDLKREDVLKLMEWMRMQPHLPIIDECELAIFLHSCYCSNEAAKVCIDNYYTARTICPEFFANRNPMSEELEICKKSLFVTPLPRLTPEGYAIIYFRFKDPSLDFFNFAASLKYFDMTSSLLRSELGPAQGLIIMVDYTDFSLGHLLKLNPVLVKKYMFFLQEALPVRLKGMHYVNAVPFIDKVVALVKPFMKKELMDVFHIHSGNNETLDKFVTKEYLPKELGGAVGSVAEIHAEYVKNFNANTDYFLKEEQMLVDESKRPGKPKNAGDLFGVEGTFKKLDID